MDETKICFIAFCFMNSRKISGVNCGPLSKTTCSDRPCDAKSAHNTSTVFSAVVEFIVMTSGHFEWASRYMRL